ncbi:hypothetical protein KS461_10740 [Pseudomonas chlororaphis]|uniref:hypothetical protein n=1 Tax=Pseudomonas chlororaphis TaxID=587753 RepID=UPI00215B18FF|nr:hypothetical protein [Pseudomonas chlororaphis]UVE47721.1 hypothetical protein KS461_10740 [Pseudomonas chlororaphis]
MPKLGELQRLYEQVRQEEQNYWKELRETLRDVLDGLAQALGLDPKLPLFLHLGVINSDGKFCRASIDQLTGQDLYLKFALQVVLSQEASLIPPNVIETEWSLRDTRDGMELIHTGDRVTSFEDSAAAAMYVTQVIEKKIASFSPYNR